MSEPARSVRLSQSGVTRLVDRLERQELVVREPCAEDRRVLSTRITGEGRRRLARPAHPPRRVRALFLQHFDEDELRSLAGAWERLQPSTSA